MMKRGFKGGRSKHCFRFLGRTACRFASLILDDMLSTVVAFGQAAIRSLEEFSSSMSPYPLIASNKIRYLDYVISWIKF